MSLSAPGAGVQTLLYHYHRGPEAWSASDMFHTLKLRSMMVQDHVRTISQNPLNPLCTFLKHFENWQGIRHAWTGRGGLPDFVVSKRFFDIFMDFIEHGRWQES